jgi:hypothetical protein
VAALPRDARLDEPRERRVQAVRADHDSGPHGLRAPSTSASSAPSTRPRALAQQLDDAEAVTDAGAGLDRGVDEHAVEQRTPRREEPGHGRPSA